MSKTKTYIVHNIYSHEVERGRVASVLHLMGYMSAASIKFESVTVPSFSDRTMEIVVHGDLDAHAYLAERYANGIVSCKDVEDPLAERVRVVTRGDDALSVDPTVHVHTIECLGKTRAEFLVGIILSADEEWNMIMMRHALGLGLNKERLAVLRDETIADLNEVVSKGDGALYLFDQLITLIERAQFSSDKEIRSKADEIFAKLDIITRGA